MKNDPNKIVKLTPIEEAFLSFEHHHPSCDDINLWMPDSYDCYKRADYVHKLLSLKISGCNSFRKYCDKHWSYGNHCPIKFNKNVF